MERSLNGNSRDPKRSVLRSPAHKPGDTRTLARWTDGLSGYTLTELVIVLGILSVVLGLSGIWLSSQLPQYRLNGVVRQIRADLLAARAQAVRQGNEVRVFFVDSQRYDILDDDNNNGRTDPGEAIESRSIQEDFEGVAIQSNNNPIFHPRGTASSLATIRVSNTMGEKTITIGITGRVKVTTS